MERQAIRGQYEFPPRAPAARAIFLYEMAIRARYDMGPAPPNAVVMGSSGSRTQTLRRLRRIRSFWLAQTPILMPAPAAVGNRDREERSEDEESVIPCGGTHRENDQGENQTTTAPNIRLMAVTTREQPPGGFLSFPFSSPLTRYAQPYAYYLATLGVTVWYFLLRNRFLWAPKAQLFGCGLRLGSAAWHMAAWFRAMVARYREAGGFLEYLFRASWPVSY